MNGQKPTIEDSNQAIAINKQLGWTIAVTLAGAFLWVGSEVATMRSAYVNLADSRAEDRASGAAVEERVRILENQAGRFEEKLSSILAAVSRIEKKLEVSP